MSRSPLEILQRRFVRSVTFLPDPVFVADVKGGGKLSAVEAVDVYRAGYPARLTEALGETYEACWRVLGDEDFFAAARDYIARAPSRTYNLSDYGEGFPAFLESRPDAARAPFIGDLARLEWAFKELFHREPHRGLSAEALAARARPNAVLRFGAATRFLALRHRVYGIWQRDRAEDSPLAASDWEGAERLLLYKRNDNDIFTRELTGPAYAALVALEAGRPLDEALAAAEGLDASGAGDLFSFIAESGIVVDVA